MSSSVKRSFVAVLLLTLLSAAPLTAAPLPIPTLPTPTTAPARDDAHEKPALANLRSTTFGQLFEGKRTLTPGEAVQLEFWLNAVKETAFAALAFVPRVIVAFILFMMFYGLYRGLRRVTLGSLSKATHLDPSVRDLLVTLLKWGIVGFGFIIACNQVGIQITGLLAGTAIIGLAIGFAAQETLANFIAGVVIFWDKPFKVDDWIDLDGRYGRVTRITFRSTRLINGDGEIIAIPNTMMLASKVTNHSTNPICRVKVTLTVSNRASIDQVRALLLALCEGDERVCAEPAPSVWVGAVNEAGTSMSLGFWIVDESKQRALESEYLESARKALDAANVEWPWSRLQVWTMPQTSPPSAVSDPMPLRRAG